MRRNGIINPFISIAWYINYNEIQIWTDGGRLCRPLYIVENNKLRITNSFVDKIVENKLLWKDLIKNTITDSENEDLENITDNAIMEYIDVNESDTLMVCMSKDNLLENKKENYSYYNYTHCEIHPSMILGVLACNIPFPDHNQALVIYIKVLWVNRQWEFILLHLHQEWTLWRIFYIILRNQL